MAHSLTRRDFLKLSGAGLLGLLAAELGHEFAFALGEDLLPGGSQTTSRQGRVAYNRVRSYASPSRDGVEFNSYRRDTLLNISATVIGGESGDYNRIWYRLGNAEEYVYSGGIQLVETMLNRTVTDLPTAGVVGEVTVPYAESWWAIHRSPFVGPRLYYSTTHWIEGLVIDKRDGGFWYKAYDHLFNAYYYVQPEFVRILSSQELAPLSPEVPAQDKCIEVYLNEQVLLAFEGRALAFSCRVSTGKGELNTPQGIFTTFHKRPTAHMVGGESDAAMYDLSGVPWNTYITENGVAMHGTFWHNDYGTPHSHGCINLKPRDAMRIYRWTQPVVPEGERFIYQPGQGTRVKVLQFGNMNNRGIMNNGSIE